MFYSRRIFHVQCVILINRGTSFSTSAVVVETHPPSVFSSAVFNVLSLDAAALENGFFMVFSCQRINPRRGLTKRSTRKDSGTPPHEENSPQSLFRRLNFVERMFQQGQLVVIAPEVAADGVRRSL
jgi:hypothetical protein